MDTPKIIKQIEIRSGILVFAILTLAFTLRFWGASFGLPFLYHADEPIVVNHALAFGNGDFNPHFFKIPPLVSYLLFGCYGIYYLAGLGVGLFKNLGSFEALFFGDPTSFYVIARLFFGVIAGTATVGLVFRITRAFWGKESALLAALFLAVNFLHARDSHYCYVDIPLVFILLLALEQMLKIQKSPGSIKHHALTGVMIGLAAAVKYNGVFLAIPYLWICLSLIPGKRLWKEALIAGACAILTFCVLNPYAILDARTFIQELAIQSQSNTGGYPWTHHLKYSLAGAFGIPFLFIAFIALVRPWIVADFSAKTLSVFAIGYYFILCLVGQPYDRYVLPLIPVLCILSAVLITEWKNKSSKLGTFFFVLFFFAMAIPSSLKIVRWDTLMAETDVRTLAKTWIESHIPSGSRIAMDWEFYMPRLSFSKDQLHEKLQEPGLNAAQQKKLKSLIALSQGSTYKLFFLVDHPDAPRFLLGRPTLPFDLKALKNQGIQYVLVAERSRSFPDSFLEELQKTGRLITRWTPYVNNVSTAINDQQPLTGGPFLWKDIKARERNGYPIRLYKLA